MNKYQTQLYKNLITLVEQSVQEKRPTFVYKDVLDSVNENLIYRIFNYQLPKYSDFLKEGAMQSRGTMFSINKETNEIKLLALPMDKFFGLGENSTTMNIKPEDIKEAYVKVDGSLLTSYITPNGTLGLKSKSEPVFAHSTLVGEYLQENDAFAADLLQMTIDGLSVDLEFVSPANRVILEYSEPQLHILNVRDRNTGEYIDFRHVDFLSKYPYILDFLVEPMDLSSFQDLTNKNKLLKLPDIEGAVIRLEDGRLVKVKTEWYMSRHNYVNIQDFSKAGQKLFMVVMEEATDELRSLLHYRNHSPNFRLEEKLEYIDKAEDKIQEAYGEFLNTIGKFYEDNKNLNEQEYMDKLRSEMPQSIGLLMPIYKGKYSTLKEAFISFYQKKIKI